MGSFLDSSTSHDWANTNGDSNAATDDARPSRHDRQRPMPIAIVGMGCRFPGDATNPEKLWQMCAEARDAWSPFPKKRFNQDAFYHPDPNRRGTLNVRGGYFIKEDLSLFDAPFFSMTSAEVAALDPQQRLLLETCYEALENAGTPVETLVGSDTSVFVGSFSRDFSDLMMRDMDSIPMYQATGSGQALLSNRLSYFFDLKGPSVTIDTACSGSLVALHLACQTLRTGESKQAIVGGSNVILSHEVMVAMTTMRFLSPDGRCYTFDERAQGYARGEGAACIILKPLEDALKAGDTIRGVIRNTGINQDGKTTGITLPSKSAQEALIRSVYDGAGLSPHETAYVEAHGTGTPAGDPIEAAAISSVFGPGRPNDEAISIGSVKTNIGHLEGASGLAGLIKTVLSLENGLIAPNCNFEKANKRIPLEEWRLKVATALEPWPRGHFRRASVNSFGYGGTNAHVIIDDACGYLSSHGLIGSCRRIRPTPSFSLDDIGHPNGHANGHADGYAIGHADGYAIGRANGLEEKTPHPRVYLVSAFHETTARQQAISLCAYLKERHDVVNDSFMDDLAFTLDERRSIHPWKRAVTADSVTSLINALENGDLKFVKAQKSPTLGFIFTGQGAQWHAMGRELIETYPVFRETMLKADHQLRTLGSSWSLLDELLQDAGKSRVGLAAISQPACTAIQIAIVDLFASWNIRAAAVAGHSSGEIAAAYAVGALTIESAIALAYHRGIAVAEVKSNMPHVKGAMAAAGISREEAEPIISGLRAGKARIACTNSPSSITVSGDEDAVKEFQAVLEGERIFNRKLAVDVAYHSHHMFCVADQYRKAILEYQPLSPGHAEFHSSVTGQLVQSSMLGPEYWVSNLISEVRFLDSVQSLCFGDQSTRKRLRKNTTGIDMLIEIGPHSALAGPIKQILQSDSRLKNASISYASALIRNVNAVSTAIELACRLCEKGYPVDLSALNCPDGVARRKVLVDLPTYTWNHSTSYWAEPRVSKTYSGRSHPRSDLLGVLVGNSNPLEPRWRNLIRPAEIPWVRDHQVQDNIVYPAAGFIVMAIEAEYQRATERAVEVEGYKIRDFNIGQALVIPESSGEVEIMFSLRPYNENLRSPSDLWDEFCVFSVTLDNTWTEHCRGLISVQKHSKPSEVDGARHADEENAFHSRTIADADARCLATVDTKALYESLKAIGLNYGPMFANMTNAHASPNQCIATITTPDTGAGMPFKFQYPFLLHPATLDSCLHAIFPAIEAEQGPLQNPLIPTFIAELFVSQKIINEPGHNFAVYAKSKKKDFRQTTGDLLIIDEGQEHPTPVMTLNGLVCISMARDSGEEADQNVEKLVYKVHWEPEIDLLSAEQILEFAKVEPPPEEVNEVRAVEKAAYFCMERALRLVPSDEIPNMHDHHKRLYECMNHWCERVREGKLGYETSEWISVPETERTEYLARVRTASDEANILCAVGEHLPEILRKEVEPLSLMLEDQRLDKYYANNSRMIRSVDQTFSYIGFLAHKNPHLNVLEIGAGTGGATLPALKALGGMDGSLPQFANYDFTDISAGFFEKAREKLDAWGDLVTYRKLDIEVDPVKQGFEEDSYDLVLASNVLHATSQMKRTMTHVRKLLKPGGKLLLIELVQEKLTTTAVFGTLPGWWIGTGEGRMNGPTLTEAKWDALLEETGFSGLKLALSDMPSVPDHQSSAMIAEVPIGVPKYPKEVIIIVDDEFPGDSLHSLRHMLEGLGLTTRIMSLLDAEPAGKSLIVLSELAQSVLSNPSPNQFESVKKILTQSEGALWVVRDAMVDSQAPNNNLITGLARTARSESGGTTIITLDLDGRKPRSGEADAEVIFKVFKRKFDSTITSQSTLESLEVEFCERDGRIMIPRILEDPGLNDLTVAELRPAVPEDQPFSQKGRPLFLEIGTPGLLDTLFFNDDPRIPKQIPDSCVEIDVKASGINFRDVMMAMGQMDVEILGKECSGIITAVGKSVNSFKVGDRVATYVDGTFANLVYPLAEAVQGIPDDMPFEVAASIPIVYCTAYHAIFNVAHVRKGETVLIHAAAGGMGQATIMICQMLGAEVFATCGTSAKKEFLMTRFGISEDHIFSSRDGNFAKGVMRMTRGRGVDVVMNSVAGELLRLTLNCIASFGRFIELGKRDFFINTRLEMARLAKNVTFAAVDLVALNNEKPELTVELFRNVMALIRAEAVMAPQPVTTFAMSEIEKALRVMQTGKHIGKLVVVAQPSDVVKVMPRDESPNLLRTDASYLLVGGLGGLGRPMAVWMQQRGARNFIFASRSGMAKEEARELVGALESLGCKVAAPSCDVSNEDQLTALLLETEKTMPRIRGVIQASMVLRSELLHKMSLDDYTASLAPKVRGTWNLHEKLSKEDLDFFIMLSSTAGIIGNASQAAYSAASTFLDAFADYRNNLGLPAVTIDLGMVSDVGYLAVNVDLRQMLEKLGFSSVYLPELLAMIKTAIVHPLRSRGSSGRSVTGLGTYKLDGSRPGLEYSIFAHFRRMALKMKQTSRESDGSLAVVRDVLQQAMSVDEAAEAVCTVLMAKISVLLMIPLEDIKASRTMSEYGMDSLVAVEMRNWLFREMDATVPILELLANEPLLQLSAKIVKRSKLANPAILGEGVETKQ